MAQLVVFILSVPLYYLFTLNCIGILSIIFETVKNDKYIAKDRHSANSFHETSIPRGSGVHTVHILQGFVLNFDFGIYYRHFAGVHINNK